MTNEISNFNWPLHSDTVSWMFQEQLITKSYRGPIKSAKPLNDKSGVAIVEPSETLGSPAVNLRNAVILNADGSERARVDFSIADNDVYGFNDMYYINGELTAMLLTTGNDRAIVVDEKTGKSIRSYETR